MIDTYFLIKTLLSIVFWNNANVIYNIFSDDLPHWLSSADPDDLFLLDCPNLNPVIDKKSWSFLVARIKLLLGMYPTTLDQDKKIIKKEKDLNGNAKLAIRMRMCEKRILSNTVEYAEKRLEKLEK